MKSIYNILFAASLCGAGFLVSCDNISEDDRYIPVDKPVLPPHSVAKTVLVQEFTGVKCVNCPTGAAELHKAQEQYEGQVIVVGMHPYSVSVNTEPFNNDMRCDEAEVMYQQYKPDTFPCAVFNGTKMSTSVNNWLTTVTDLVAEEAQMTIDVSCDYDDSNRNLKVDYAVNFTSDINKDLSVMVWIMENHIVGLQNMPGGAPNPLYEHNHVLRASLNGDWGQKIGSSFKNGRVEEGTASITLYNGGADPRKPAWVPENCQVVVWVFDTATKAVEQAALADVIPAVTPEPGPDEEPGEVE